MHTKKLNEFNEPVEYSTNLILSKNNDTDIEQEYEDYEDELEGEIGIEYEQVHESEPPELINESIIERPEEPPSMIPLPTEKKDKIVDFLNRKLYSLMIIKSYTLETFT